MKTKISVAITLMLLFMFSMMLSAQTYDKRWKEVEKAWQDGLPQTAAKQAEGIFRKAEAEKNSAQMLKAYTARSDYRQIIDPDSFYVDLKGLEQWAATATSREDRAVLHTLIAQIYSDYADRNRWDVRRRTNVADDPADDIREWSGNMFVRKVLDHTRAVSEDSVGLFGLSSKKYVPFVTQRPASRYYHHNMYQLLSFYNIRSLSQMSVFDTDSVIIKAIEQVYSSLNRMYKQQQNMDALVLLALDELEWQKSNGSITPAAYLKKLDELIRLYGEHEIVVEVYMIKVQNLIMVGKKAEAYQLCRDVMSKYARYERINAIKELQEEILRPFLYINMSDSSYPEDTLVLNVLHVNIGGFTVNYHKVDLPVASPLLPKEPDEEFYEKYTRKVRTEHFSLVPTTDYQRKDTVCRLIAPEEGLYAVQIIPDDKGSEPIGQLLSVSALKLLSRRLPAEQFEVFALDAKSGQPIEGATVHLFTSDRGDMKLMRSVKTHADGRAETSWNDDYMFITAGKDGEPYILPQQLHRGYYAFSDEKQTENQRLALLTDRSLYRPGQTVYVKGIAYTQQSYTANVAVGRTYTLILHDVNYREVSRKELTTNAFGSFATEFVLPSGGLNGIYILRAEGGESIFFRVEEYKRPTFEVTFDRQEGTFQLDDSVNVKGSVKTYSGIPVQDTFVRYRVTRRLFGWWGRYYDSNAIINSGTVSLNDAGEFTLPVVLQSGDGLDSDRGFYIFTVSATVTNAAGETQTSSTAFAVGERSLLLDANVPGRVNKDEDIKITFRATNLSHQPVTVEGEYKLYRFSDYATETTAEVPADAGTFTSNVETLLPQWKALPTGIYKLMLTAKDERGRVSDYETEVILFSINDNRPAEGVGLWYYPVNMDFDASHPGEFMFGTSQKDAYVFMDVFSGNKRLESRLLHLSDSVIRFVYPYKSEYEDGLKITFCYVKDDKAYTQDVSLSHRLPDKELKLSWSVFRNKLRPGQQEEWKLTIKNPDGSFADAELLATMYDASLEKIWKHRQALSAFYSLYLPSTQWEIYRRSNNSYYFWYNLNALSYPDLLYDYFGTEPLGIYPNNDLIFEETSSISTLPMESRAAGDIRIRGTAGNDLSEVAVRDEKDFETAEDADQQLPAPTGNLRTNFTETAFFYPQLRTNEKGEAVIAFTMPESLTRWNFNGYAHTKDMFTGMISGEVVTSKEFMLTPNLPRFVRVGDHTSVAASVANLTGRAVSGNVVLTLFDPLTEKVIATQKQKFTAEAGKTVGVNFMFTPTDTYDLLGCRLVAEGGDFSDGEQHLLPVLSNKERVIETVAMPVRGHQTREFSLEKLFNDNSPTATGRSLTVEFSGNPAWYAVQALPSLSLPANDNAVSWATAYYANTLASYIMNSQPRLKAVFDAWKKQGGTKETFLSNLQKNQDVKNILLEESPWMLEATTEQEQKERIATLFDLNNIRNNNVTALNKLRDLQLSSGAWTWYKGMPPSHYITTYVMQSLIRLKALTGQPLDDDAAAMYDRAFAFLHGEALQEYKNIRKAEQNGTEVQGISANALQYLYFVALSGESVPEENETAYDYFLNKTKETISDRSITVKAITAVILQKAGHTSDARSFIASLKEYLTQTDERGMFFAFNENPYSWAGLKVPAHVSVMEAFDLVGNDAATVEEMKLWLLKEKQTQQWNSPVATANAVYALLYRGASLTENQGDVRITLGNKTMETLSPISSAIPGIAYIKETITDKNTLSKAKKVVVEKRDAGIAWGAVYAQYEEESDKVTSYGEGLNVDKKLYVERIDGVKKELIPIVPGTRLKVGDKVVSRIIIKLDRAMDFVQLKDQRAACFEPTGNLSGYIRESGTGYYVAVKDASTNFYFDALSKGVYVLEHSYRVSRTGTYESGLATIQSAYAPEYASHAPSVKVTVFTAE